MSKENKSSASSASLASELTPADYEKLGREIEHVIASSYTTTYRAVFFSFIRGLATGIGSVIGASVAVVILFWILSGLEKIPFIGETFENINQSIQEKPSR